MLNLFPSRVWLHFSQTGGAYFCLSYFRTHPLLSLRRCIELWCIILSALALLQLIVSIGAATTNYTFLIKMLFLDTSDTVQRDLGILIVLMFISAILALLVGAIGLTSVNTGSILSTKVFILCNYLHIAKDIAFLVAILVLLSKWKILTGSSAAFFSIIIGISLILGIYVSYISENYLDVLEIGGTGDELATAAELESQSTVGQDLEFSKEEDSSLLSRK
ncbi:hypothetical protein ACR3K2_28250 [Cryptosporidium serpentis]